MKILPVLFLVLFLSGCSTWMQATFMNEEDTQQAIALEASQDPKLCMKVKGSGSAMGVNGYVEIIKAKGQNVSFQDCINYFHQSIVPVTLPPDSRMRVPPLPPEKRR